MEQPSNKPLPILEEIKIYLQTKFKLWEYRAIEKSTTILSELIVDLTLIIIALLILIFFSITSVHIPMMLTTVTGS